MAKPYEEGSGWAMRRRHKGRDIYLSGFASEAAVKKEMKERLQGIDERGNPKGLGPHRTTVAQALQDYGIERLPFMKGARQEANRINKYLRAAGLQVLQVRGIESAVDPAGDEVVSQAAGRLFDVALGSVGKRVIPKGLTGHRGDLAKARAKSDAVRARLAGAIVADVKRFDLQAFIDALRGDKLQPATVHLERALLRGIFNHAHFNWNWTEPRDNPATGLKMPQVDNGRERVMSIEEQKRLDAVIADCRNGLVGPVVTLLRETAMRASEPLERARWGDVDWDNKLLHLRDAKAGKRDVPLSPVGQRSVVCGSFRLTAAGRP